MSNANPFMICAVAISGLATVAGCSLPQEAYHAVRPYQEDAFRVVAAVAAHTPLEGSCRRIATDVVEAGIAERMARRLDEMKSAAEASSVAAIDWDRSGCPAAAVPGLSFGMYDVAKQIANRAHKTAGLL